MPSGASPRDTSSNAARTFSAGATLAATDVHTPSASSDALPYLPAGPRAGAAIARRPSPSAWASPKLAVILICAALLLGAIRTIALLARLWRVSDLISDFRAR